MGMIVRRYIDFLILLIPTPLVSVLQQHPYYLFILKKFIYIYVGHKVWICAIHGLRC